MRLAKVRNKKNNKSVTKIEWQLSWRLASLWKRHWYAGKLSKANIPRTSVILTLACNMALAHDNDESKGPDRRKCSPGHATEVPFTHRHAVHWALVALGASPGQLPFVCTRTGIVRGGMEAGGVAGISLCSTHSAEVRTKVALKGRQALPQFTRRTDSLCNKLFYVTLRQALALDFLTSIVGCAFWYQ